MVKQRYPQSELLAAGWSLGANILVRYLGEAGAECPISAAVSMCNPFDLVSLLTEFSGSVAVQVCEALGSGLCSAALCAGYI